MRILGLTLTLFAAALFGACGDKADDTTTTEEHHEDGDHDGDHDHDEDGDHKHAEGDHEPEGMPLAGASWDGGDAFDPTKHSDKVRIVAFFKPG